jgi:hypothetical protein
MVHLQVAFGDDLKVWMVAMNILNKQSQAFDKGWSSSLRIGHGANTIRNRHIMKCYTGS